MSTVIPVLCFLATFALISGIQRIELVPWLRLEGKHWTERARVLWPVRKTSVLLLIYLPLLISLGSGLLDHPGYAGLIVRWLVALAGALVGGWFMVRRMHPGLRFRGWLHDLVIGTLLRLGLWLLLIGVGFTMPEEFQLRTWLTLTGVVVLMVCWPFVAIGALRWAGIIRPAGERLRDIVAGCSREGGPQVRGLWQASGSVANALALPLSGTLIFYDKLLENLTDQEVAGVCAHELGHLAESGRVLVGRYLGGMAILPLLLIRPASAQWEFAGFLGMLILTILWSRLSRKLVHRMETRADAIAAAHLEDSSIYARALEKIYQLNHLPAVMPGKRGTHPHLYDRMLAAGVEPDFPRPRVPGKYTPLGWILIFAGPFGIYWLISNGILQPNDAMESDHPVSGFHDDPPESRTPR